MKIYNNNLYNSSKERVMKETKMINGKKVSIFTVKTSIIFNELTR